MKKNEVSLTMSAALRKRLEAEGVEARVIDALEAAVKNVTSAMRSKTIEYATGLDDYQQKFGTEALKRNVTFMLDYMKLWTGVEAKQHKQTLVEWATAKKAA